MEIPDQAGENLPLLVAQKYHRQSIRQSYFCTFLKVIDCFVQVEICAAVLLAACYFDIRENSFGMRSSGARWLTPVKQEAVALPNGTNSVISLGNARLLSLNGAEESAEYEFEPEQLDHVQAHLEHARQDCAHLYQRRVLENVEFVLHLDVSEK